jgi:replicative DNA helicase
MAIDSAEMRKAILHNLIQNEEFARKTLPFLQKEYFGEKHEQIIFETVQAYSAKYDTPPSYEAAKIEVESRADLTEATYSEVSTFLSKAADPIKKTDFLVDRTEQWCQERAIVNAVYKAVNIIGGEDKKTPMTALPDLLSKAIGTSFDNTF